MIFAKYNIRILSILVLSASLSSCATSPTGRNQLMLVSDVEMTQMGMKAYDQIKRKEKLSNHPGQTQYVRCVANQIIAQLPPRYASQAWEVNLFQDDSPNAFALPGGKVGVNTGIFTVARNQHQLAAEDIWQPLCEPDDQLAQVMSGGTRNICACQSNCPNLRQRNAARLAAAGARPRVPWFSMPIQVVVEPAGDFADWLLERVTHP